MSVREVRRVIRYISKNYTTRRPSFTEIKPQLHINASESTIRRDLKKNRYQRYIACPQPFISRKTGKSRLAFAKEHRWWVLAGDIVSLPTRISYSDFLLGHPV